MVKNTGSKRKIQNRIRILSLLVPLLFLFGKVKTASALGLNAVGDKVGDTLLIALKFVIYSAFVLFGWFAGVAITLFDIMIQPSFFQILNQQGIYEMWKFIRDFFNLFFILTLLYIAFTIVFQVAKDYKKTLLNLVIMALLVNFSFPISRALIDVGNVPMYFFANQISDKGATQGLGAIFSASNLQGILLFGAPSDPASGGVEWKDVKGDNIQIPHLLAATIFMFVFAITLLVLAVMFVIRFAALAILVIFSSVGFAGTVIPPLRDQANKWWSNFFNYVLYGPAAMLMILVAVRFFQVLSSSNINALSAQSASNLTASGMQGFMASAAVFAIPIVILWMAIGLSSSMSIAGSNAVVGYGKGAIGWTRKKAIGGAKWAAYRNPVARGLGAGLKEKTGINSLQKWMKSPSKVEAAIKGGVIGAGTAKGVRGGAREELKSIRDQQIREKVEEHKKNKTSASALENDLKSKDEVKKRAAALALADSKDITSPDRLHMALSAVADDMDQYTKVLQSADGKSMGISADQLEEAVAERDESGAIKRDTTGKIVVNDKAYKAVSSKMKKEGRVDVVVDYRAKKLGERPGDAVRDILDKMTPEEIAKQADLFKHAAYGTDAKIEVGSLLTSDPQRYQEIKKRATGEVSRLI